jgi:methionine-rich copper-binding protein CopC
MASLFLFGVTPVVQAHSDFVRSAPAKGAVLKAAPKEIKIWFSDPIKTALSTIEVSDPNGKQVDLGNLHADEKEPRLVRLSLAPRLAPGVYRVSWNAVAQDLHVGKGAFTFQIRP